MEGTKRSHSLPTDEGFIPPRQSNLVGLDFRADQFAPPFAVPCSIPAQLACSHSQFPQLEDLYVTESRRNQGIGKLLFGHLGRIARAKKCGRVEWRVLKWNKPSIGFYVETVGATPQSEWEGMRLEGDEEIARLEKFLQ